MDRDELTRLSRLARAGDVDARNEIVVANMGLVGHVVKGLRRRLPTARRLPWEDLKQEGCLGLIRAAERWDADRGCPFSTYAGRWIEAFAREAIHRSALVVSANGTRKLAIRWRRLAAGGMAGPEIARELGLSPERVACVKAALAVDSACVHGAVEAWDDDLSVPPSDLPSEAEDWLHEGLSRLDPWDREALVLLYGLGGTKPLACREIGRRLGVSGQAALNAVGRAKERLAAALAG